ncbi:MAG: SurA N-terminal domain-containing protein [Chloroflexota bacterium]
MAKRNDDNERVPRSRRREERLSRQQESQMRTLRLAAIGLAAIIGIIVIIGLIVELAIVPSQVVAEVQTGSIQMGDWQERVRFERAQIIAQIEEQLDLFIDDEAEDPQDAEENALRTIQQFAGQQLNSLILTDQLGEQVLELMIQEELIRQGAEERGITVSQSEVDASIGEQFNYFDGGLPTPIPTATQTPMPTPSITPIPTDLPEGVEPVEEAVVVDVEEPTPFPTSTPRPTNTPVSETSFDEQLQEELDSIDNIGGNPDLYLTQFEFRELREKFSEVLFEESGEAIEVPHISAFLLVYNTEEEAIAAEAAVNERGFLTAWNELRSAPVDPTVENPPTALERLNLTAEEYGQTYTDVLPEMIETLEIGEPSGVIQDFNASNNLPVYLIVQVSGSEIKELNEFTIQRKHQEALREWLDEQRNTGVTVFENWRSRIPRQPMIDSKFISPVNTPTPPPADGGLDGIEGFEIPEIPSADE